MKAARKLTGAIIAVLIIAVVVVIGVVIAIKVQQHREEAPARRKLEADVVAMKKRLADTFRDGGRLPTDPQQLSTPSVVSQNSGHAVVFARLGVEYRNTVFMPSTDSVDECHLFTLDRADGEVRVRDAKVSCTMASRPSVESAPHLTAASLAGIDY
ncbi:hypothetical protein [Streptomyces sp. NPDC018610]|uniref:hypothetical protein n=1 Tax=Streptomyces sp. NPDC018610 TaxID=3365049 RepID=UPI0037A24026